MITTDIPEENLPSDESMARYAESTDNPTETCSVCGEPVTNGARRSVMGADGESWQHNYHP